MIRLSGHLIWQLDETLTDQAAGMLLQAMAASTGTSSIKSRSPNGELILHG